MNFTKEDSGDHDAEKRVFENYLLPSLTHKMKKICMYVHSVFYNHPLEDLATKGIPGGGADANGGRLQPAARRKSEKITKDDLVEVFAAGGSDDKIGDALTAIAQNQACAVGHAPRFPPPSLFTRACACLVSSQADNNKRQKMELLRQMKTNGELTDEQEENFSKATDAMIASLL